VDIGRNVDQGQTGDKVRETPISTNGWAQGFMPVIPALQRIINRIIWIKASLGIKPDPISKITNRKRAGRVVQVVECLPSKHQALSSTPVPPKKEKKKKHNERAPPIFIFLIPSYTRMNIEFLTLLNTP
jgi:hypothetical protein